MPRQSTSPNTPGPPRLLLGATVLFWGGIVGHPLIGLILALALEACHWTRVRWDFSDQSFYRAWQTSVLLLLFTGVLIWLDGQTVSALPRTLVWLPLLLMPLQFVQSYGMQSTMPLATFSLFVRKRRAHAARHGLPFRDVRVSFGYVYFATALIAASLGKEAKELIFFPGVVILVAWAFWRQFSWSRRFAPLAALVILAVSISGGYGGERLLDFLYKRYVMGSYGSDPLDFARQTRTSIGDLGEIKQSPDIKWRLRPIHGSFPDHLRIASYNTYRNTYWSAAPPPEVQPPRADFNSLTSVGIDTPLYITARKDAFEFIAGDQATADSLPRFTLRGSLAEKGLFPIPGNTTSLSLPVQDIEINSFGTLRIDPRNPVADATILWDSPQFTEKPPWRDEEKPEAPVPDLRIPKTEEPTVSQVASELDLRHGSLGRKINVLRKHFTENFTYTRYLTLSDERKAERENGSERYNPETFIGRFLTKDRRGHCEYFATATTLLLREAGVPARYTTGFAVTEIDPRSGEAVVRGTHAHAWCRAWDEEKQRWIDVDLTPPDWTGLEQPDSPPWQELLDRWQMLREDLTVWRSQPGNLAIAAAILAIPLGLGGFLVGRRLWRSRRRLDPVATRRNVRPEHAASPLTRLEKPAARRLGTRPPGAPLGRWLQQLAPGLPDSSDLTRAIDLHRLLRFDPRPPDPALLEQLDQLVARLRNELERLK